LGRSPMMRAGRGGTTPAPAPHKPAGAQIASAARPGRLDVEQDASRAKRRAVSIQITRARIRCGGSRRRSIRMGAIADRACVPIAAHICRIPQTGAPSRHPSDAGRSNSRGSLLTRCWRRQSGANPSLKWDFRNNARFRGVYRIVTAAKTPCFKS
jgi:hypothetical protein